jgi:hypothetical protein
MPDFFTKILYLRPRKTRFNVTIFHYHQHNYSQVARQSVRCCSFDRNEKPRQVADLAGLFGFGNFT